MPRRNALEFFHIMFFYQINKKGTRGKKYGNNTTKDHTFWNFEKSGMIRDPTQSVTLNPLYASQNLSQTFAQMRQ